MFVCLFVFQACVSSWTCCWTLCPCWATSSSSASSSSSSSASSASSCGRGFWGTAATRRRTSHCESPPAPCLCVCVCACLSACEQAWERSRVWDSVLLQGLWLVVLSARLSSHDIIAAHSRSHHTVYSVWLFATGCRKVRRRLHHLQRGMKTLSFRGNIMVLNAK